VIPSANSLAYLLAVSKTQENALKDLSTNKNALAYFKKIE